MFVCVNRREATLRQLETELKQERSLTETMVADMVCDEFLNILYSVLCSINCHCRILNLPHGSFN